MIRPLFLPLRRFADKFTRSCGGFAEFFFQKHPQDKWRHYANFRQFAEVAGVFGDFIRVTLSFTLCNSQMRI